MKILLTAEIDAETEGEAQDKLDELRDYLADFTTEVYRDITIYRSQRRELIFATENDENFASEPELLPGGGNHGHVSPFE
jgi:hypothetical protein